MEVDSAILSMRGLSVSRVLDLLVMDYAKAKPESTDGHGLRE